MKLPPKLPEAEMPMARIDAMVPLEVLIARAWEAHDARTMAVLAHAWTLVGFAEQSFDTFGARPGEALGLAISGAARRPYRLLRAQAIGMLHAIQLLMEDDFPLSKRSVHNAHHVPQRAMCQRYVDPLNGRRQHCILEAGHREPCYLVAPAA